MVDTGAGCPSSIADGPATDASSLILDDGARVAVVGGGPAGSFSYFLLKMAEAVDLQVGIDIYEPRSFSRCGPGGCNHCGGPARAPSSHSGFARGKERGRRLTLFVGSNTIGLSPIALAGGAQGRRVESQSDFQAVLIHGHRPNHLLHFVIGLFTIGIWWLVWLVMSVVGGEKREMVTVDEWGNVTVQKL